MNVSPRRHSLTTGAFLLLALLIASVKFGAAGIVPRSATASADGGGGKTVPTGLATTAAPDKTNRASVTESYGKLPMSFEANRGQTDARVKFLARGDGYSLFLTPSEAVLSLSKSAAPQNDGESSPRRRGVRAGMSGRAGARQDVLRMKLAGADPSPRVVGLEELPGQSNYLRGNDPKRWRTGVEHYAKVRYESVYRGVDMVFYGNQRQLEYDFIVAPGADPSAITLAFQGARNVEIDAAGDLVLHTKGGKVRQHKPFIYQETDGRRSVVAGHYVKRGKRRVGFEVAGYDATRPLVIDPVLVYSTYLGGSNNDLIYGVAADGAGNTYVTGYTASLDFPATAGAFQTSHSGGEVAFVTKLDASGSALAYSTYLDGAGGTVDQAYAIAVDGAGQAYVAGVTYSPDFPTTAGAFDTSADSSGDAFVTKLSASGSSLIYSTRLGGSTGDVVRSIAVDGAGQAYVTGHTDSTSFPTTPGAFDLSPNGGIDTFATKLNASGSALVYSTYLGGAAADAGLGIALDGSGNAYLIGETHSTNFPTTAGALDTSRSGGTGNTDAFVTKLNASGSALVYSTYLGGSGTESGNAVAVDGTGHAYLTGQTTSNDYPIAPGAYDPFFGGSFDVFVTKLGPSGSEVVYSTFLGSSGNDLAYGIALDRAGYAYVTGSTDSANFPTTAGALDTSYGGGTDAFLTKFSPSGSALDYSAFFGGSDYEIAHSIAVDGAGNVHLAGLTKSLDLPTTPGAFDASNSGGFFDSYVARLGGIAPTPTPPPCPAVVLHPQAAPAGTVGSPYSLTFAPTGGVTPYTFAASGTLPAGLSLSAGTGELAGTPAGVGVFNFTVVATDANGCAGGAAHTITVNPAATPTPAPTPQINARRIAFETNRDGNSEIYVMDADGRNPARLTNNGARDADPFFSPDGSRIVFSSNRDGNYEIYVMNADDTNQTRLTTNSVDDYRPAFSPDGTKIAFYRGAGNGSEIYVMNADGTNQVRITNNSSADSFPKWSSGGARLIFQSDRDGDFDIYTMNADGSDVVKLTNNNSYDNEASFSPDGMKIVFASDRTGNTEVWVMNADGSQPVNLSNSSSTDGSCSWSADGKKVLFVSARDGNAEVYSMNADGTGQTRLTVNNALENTPVSGVLPRINHAAASNGGTVTASSTTPDTEFPGLTFPASGVIDGDRRGLNWEHGGGWRDGTNNSFPDWIEVQFAGVRAIEEVDVFSLQDDYTSPSEPTESMTFTLYGLHDFDVEYWNGLGWAAVPSGQVVNNNLVWRKFVFPALSTNKIRVLVKNAAAGRSRIMEVEAY